MTLSSRAGAADHREVVGDQHQADALLPQPVEDAEHLRLDRHVERGGRLVGQDQAGLGRQRDGDADPLPHAARQLVREGAVALLGVADADLVEQVERPRPGGRPAHPQPLARHLGDLVADPHGRVQRGERVLEDHRHRRRDSCAALRRAQAGHVRPPTTTLPPVIRAGTGSRSIAARSVRLLPDPDSPTRPTASPACAVSETPRTACSVPSGERDLDVEVVQLQQRRAHRRPLRCTVPSATSASARPASTTARPGAAVRYHLVNTKPWPSAIIEPQSGVGGGTPRPR